jgi:hypothetical protein
LDAWSLCFLKSQVLRNTPLALQAFETYSKKTDSDNDIGQVFLEGMWRKTFCVLVFGERHSREGRLFVELVSTYLTAWEASHVFAPKAI